MKVGEPLSLGKHGRVVLRGLCEMVVCFVGQMSVIRHSYEHWVAVRLPGPVQSVLFVCTGNICRSPLAAAYFQSLVENEGRQLTVRSAGLETTPGKPAHVKAKAVAMQYRLSLDEHVTCHVHKDLIDQSDLIVVMEILQKDRIQRVYPRSKGKIVLLGGFDSVRSVEIADPIRGTCEDFQSCFQQVRRCCDVLAVKLGIMMNGEPTGNQVMPVNSRNS